MHRSLLFPTPSTYMLWMFGDEMLCQVAKPELGGVIQGYCFGFLGTHGRHGTGSQFILFIVDPKPRCKVRLVRIKQNFHPILDVRRCMIYSRVRGPVLSGVESQWEALDVVAVNVIV